MAVARSSAAVDLAAAGLPENQRACYARALAFSAWLSSSKTHARRAAAALDAAGRGPWPSWCAAAETLGDYALAFDFLRTTEALGRHAREHFVERVGERMAAGIAVYPQLPQNNWSLQALSGIGILTLALWHESTPWPLCDWLEVVIDGISRLLFGLVSSEGVYLEGPGYSRRASVGFIPFAWAYTLRCGVDLINFPSFTRWMSWLVEVLYPDGTNPPIDDSRREALHPFALLCHRHCRQASLFRWAADRQRVWHEIWDLPALLLYDDRIRPHPPVSPPHRILERSGMAVVRSDWSPHATYGLIVARPLPPLEPGQADSAHRHDDPTNFLIYANGEPLLHDAGYGSWGHPQRYTWFLQGEAHNLILVDGHGPPRCTYHRGDGRDPNVSTSNGRVRCLFESPDLVVVRTETDYLHVGFTRFFLFARRHYFVLLDAVDSAAVHTYDWVLHGAGALRQLSPAGALWRTRHSWLAVWWIAPANLRVSRHRGMHDEGQHQITLHDYVRAATTGKRVVFFTVLVPGRRNESLPSVEPLRVESPAVGVTVTHGKNTDHFVFNPWGGTLQIALPGHRARRLRGQWGAIMEANGRLVPRGNGWA